MSAAEVAMVPVPASTPITSMSIYQPRNFEEALVACERLVKSGFLGPHIKDANQALAIAMTGAELGFPFMASFRKIYVFQQRIGIMSVLLVAKVKASAECLYFRTKELTDVSCTVETHRRGAPEPESYTFTLPMAVRAGYVEKNAKYKTEPQRMLYARAAGYLCNDTYADLTNGIETAETLSDYVDSTASVLPADSRPIVEPRVVPDDAPADGVPDSMRSGASWADLFSTAGTMEEMSQVAARFKAVGTKSASERKAVGAAYNKRMGELQAQAVVVPAHDPVTGEVEPTREMVEEG